MSTNCNHDAARVITENGLECVKCIKPAPCDPCGVVTRVETTTVHQSECWHTALNADGICKSCGADCRGIG